MRFTATADTDIGISKNTNQDSVLVKHAAYDGGEVLLAVICDGMGGLARGELASATVVRTFARWFDEELPYELADVDLEVIGGKWSLMLKDLNAHILETSRHYCRSGEAMGTTFTGILFVNDRYVIAHVGDTRIYQITSEMRQLTTDQTFVAREVSRGTMTMEQALQDKRRNMLLQCIGASESVTPQILTGTAVKGAYMLCSDGFRHEITPREMYESLNPVNLINKKAMHSNARYLIEQVKSRQEKDNISVVLIKVE